MATLRFYIVPNAKENKVIGEHGSAIKISCESVRSSERVREETASPGWMVQAIKNKGRKMFASPVRTCDDVFVSVSVRSDVLAEGELCFT
ncbi:MAG: hypothetical protein DMF17_05930 [Verrucomicrobia bacterium]|nr:MAG: hypothetical protein DMF17_05930 [Verrucomicrobiota bacterium]